MAYYVPIARICLFSVQTYYQENGMGRAALEKYSFHFQFASKQRSPSVLTLQYRQGSNLPAGYLEKEVKDGKCTYLGAALESVVDDKNIRLMHNEK
eukprot:10173328-Ditylum_brightwellii.AAC.1